MVTGPSLTMVTCMSAPNEPVATRTLRIAISVTNCSYSGSAISGVAAGFMQGSLEVAEAIQLAITALLAMFVRSGIKSDTGN